MKTAITKTTLVISLLFIVTIPLVVQAQEAPVIFIGFREIRLTPDDFGALQTLEPTFSSDPALQALVNDNSTMFWTALEGTGYDLKANASVTSYAISQVDNSSFHQKIVGLSPENGSLLWVRDVPSEYAANFSLAILESTEYFVNDSKYWGLCEDIVLLPGGFSDTSEDVVWKVSFYLVAESERWTLYLGLDGSILSVSSTDVPCQTCLDYTPIIVIAIAAIVVLPLGFFLFRKERNDLDSVSLPESNA